ncbi:hypothetical protein NDU88_006115 [Pleurodeles waltl]|uniref:Secreted protein n=1 Tax=Pleurodeles waltl TaxID=8319 RepID=A0AAV7MBA6_PLEWA|nr:hypothetical protein NDU88_006115 [Pleurodeles waltl]
MICFHRSRFCPSFSSPAAYVVVVGVAGLESWAGGAAGPPRPLRHVTKAGGWGLEVPGPMGAFRRPRGSLRPVWRVIQELDSRGSTW